MSDLFIRTVPMMGTVVSIQIVGHGRSAEERRDRDAVTARAFAWFEQVESCCTRFDERSELRRLCARVGEPVVVSELLFQALHFSLTVAAESDGAFDPTVGGRMEARGFDTEFRTGTRTPSPGAAGNGTSFRDLSLDPVTRTVTLLHALTLDLGAVAKGLAIDLAARELRRFNDYAIDAGGDLYLAGTNADGEPWIAGVRHPRVEREVIETLHLSNAAVCTSGDYERAGVATDGGHHIVDARTAASASLAASATVVAPSAMVADALATAAFVLGPVAGIDFLEEQGATGVVYTAALGRFVTATFDSSTQSHHGTAARRA